jgi:hypothetical protein
MRSLSLTQLNDLAGAPQKACACWLKVSGDLADFQRQSSIPANYEFTLFAEITTWLHEALGEEVPTVSRELVLADRALQLIDKAQRGGKAEVDAVRHLVGAC